MDIEKMMMEIEEMHQESQKGHGAQAGLPQQASQDPSLQANNPMEQQDQLGETQSLDPADKSHPTRPTKSSSEVTPSDEIISDFISELNSHGTAESEKTADLLHDFPKSSESSPASPQGAASTLTVKVEGNMNFRLQFGSEEQVLTVSFQEGNISVSIPNQMNLTLPMDFSSRKLR